MTSLELRRRAIRAALAVSFTAAIGGTAGCVAVVETVEPPDGNDDTQPPPKEEPKENEGSIKAGVTTGDICDCTGAADMAACCDAVNWSFDCGCMAWGPPMPPPMGAA